MPEEFTEQTDTVQRPDGETVVAGTPVVVRRSAGVAALVGAAASAVAIAYLWRASQTMTVLDWTLFGVMSLVAAVYLASLVDARTPLLVADDLGVRVRLGHEWRGLPWEAIGQVVVHPRRGFLRDGRLVFTPRSLARALDGLDARGRRQVALNQKLYGAALAVPLGTTTRVSGTGERGLAAEIADLALGRAEVLELDPRTLEVVETGGDPGPGPGPDAQPQEQAEAADVAATPGGGVGVDESDTCAAGEVDPPASRQVFPAAHTDAGLSTRYDRPGEGEPAAAGAVAETVADPVQPIPVEGVQVGESPLVVDGAVEVRAGRPPRRSILGGIGTIVSRVAKGRAHDVDADPAPAAGLVDGAPVGEVPAEDATVEQDTAGGAASKTGVPPLAAPAPLRDTRPGLRAEATLDLAPTEGSAALHPEELEPAAEGREMRRPGSVDLVFERVDLDDRVRPISTLGDPVEPLVIDDYVTEPAYDPVIGPELTAARTRLGLSVDDLAERTRIRPHVIESIEVDDFAPCGGDFYSRGHLRTLARILGKDPAPLLEKFEERYATAPINARRVFEAELATGMTGSIRSTVGGPNWGLLVGVVLSLVLVWGVARLFTTEPVEMVEVPAPVLDGSAGLDSGYPAGPGQEGPAAVEPVNVRLTASEADTRVVVRDADGMVVFSGELVLGERKTLRLAPPVRVRAADGGAVEVRVDGRDRGLLGEAGEPARRTFR
ncbi:MAG TPA: RodZ domain-containing protein [Nocardioidaceae bacterium]|nr:RodZ domain-containing protein [Nocardioidaceae bacterium]